METAWDLLKKGDYEGYKAKVEEARQAFQRRVDSGVLPELVPCPCGQIPENIIVSESDGAGKWGVGNPSCCGEWAFEFRLSYHDPDGMAAKILAFDSWNELPRKEK